MGDGPGHADTAAWRRTKRATLRNSAGTCQLCWLPLNPSAAPKTPDATEYDHILEVSEGGAPYDPTNVRCVHRRCHQQRHSDDATKRRRPATSNAW